MVDFSIPNQTDINIILVFCIEVDVSHNVETAKPDKRVTKLDNPSEIIKQAQKEIVINNSSYKDYHKAPQQKGNESLECMYQLHTVRPV